MIHHVYANQSNIGDWLSALGIQGLLGGLAVKEHFCDTPVVPETIAALAECTAEDFIIVGGGGLFMDYFSPFWERFYPIANRTRFCIWGVGCCDHKRAETKLPTRLLQEIIAQSEFCLVRDELTRQALVECALPAPVACPTFEAISARPVEQAGLLYVDHYDLLGEENYQRVVTSAQTFAKETGRPYRQINNLIPKSNKTALANSLNLYASSDLVLTSRLHGCIIGLAMGRPVLAVSGDRKIESFMAAAGLSEWVCTPDDLGSLPERLARLSTQAKPDAFLTKTRSDLRAVAAKVRSLIEVAPAEQTT